MKREPWDTDAHRERMRQLVAKETTLWTALREATREWRQQMDALEGVVNMSQAERDRARGIAILGASTSPTRADGLEPNTMPQPESSTAH
jgi:hypothetical protein